MAQPALSASVQQGMIGAQPTPKPLMEEMHHVAILGRGAAGRMATAPLTGFLAPSERALVTVVISKASAPRHGRSVPPIHQFVQMARVMRGTVKVALGTVRARNPEAQME